MHVSFDEPNASQQLANLRQNNTGKIRKPLTVFGLQSTPVVLRVKTSRAPGPE